MIFFFFFLHMIQKKRKRQCGEVFEELAESHRYVQRSRLFMISFNPQTSDDVMNGHANDIFHEDNFVDMISNVKRFRHYVVIYLAKQMQLLRFTKRTHHCEIEQVIGVGERSFQKHLNWDLNLERILPLPQMPIAKPGYIIKYVRGRYAQLNAVNISLLTITHSMNLHSIARGHFFDFKKAFLILKHAFMEVNNDFTCGCRRLCCKKTMDLFGTNQISPQRSNQDLGYCDQDQSLKLVVKGHNTSVPFNSIPRDIKYPKSWIIRTSENMHERTKMRVKRMEEKGNFITEKERLQIERFSEEEKIPLSVRQSASRELLLEKRKRQADKCSKCARLMTFGDKNGIIMLVNVDTCAGTDRIDNGNVFYDDDNYTLVCLSCNFAEDYNVRKIIRYPVGNRNIPLSEKIRLECIEWLDHKIAK